jgi:predicted DNA-binding antitoxin AbrB/MazE fold protein
MEDENGKTVKLKEGAEVNVVIEADKTDTTEK